MVSLCLQICLCIDLILTLKQPFKRKEGRMPGYIAFTLGAASLTIALQEFVEYHPENYQYNLWLALFLIISLWILSIGSVTLGFVKLCKPGISQKARRQILARHIVTIIFFLMSNLYLEVSTVQYMLDPYRDSEVDDGYFAITLKIFLGLQGWFMPLTRLFEPFFYTIMLKKLREIRWPCGGKDNAIKLEQADDETFLGREEKGSEVRKSISTSENSNSSASSGTSNV